MYKNNLFKRSCLIASAIMLSAPQAAVAEDEATVTVSGWINEAGIFYDDGKDTAFSQVSDNGTTLGSRINFAGTYKPEGSDINAGFEVIMEPQSGNNTLLSDQAAINSSGGGVGLLGSSVHIGGSWGKLTVGLQSMPTDNIAVLADPSGTIWTGISPVFRLAFFDIQGLGGGASNTNWASFLQCAGLNGLGIGIDCNGVYRNGVRYDLPAFGDVSVAIGYANEEIYDVAAKYANASGDFTTNINVGYSVNKNGGKNLTAGGAGTSTDLVQVQAGTLHNESGLFGLVTLQLENTDDAVAGSGDDTTAYYLKFGVKKGWYDIGKTALYVDFGLYEDQYGQGNADGITGSEVTRVGLGAVQDLGDRLKVYAKWEQLSLDVDGTATAEALYAGAEDLSSITLGGVYFF